MMMVLLLFVPPFFFSEVCFLLISHLIVVCVFFSPDDVFVSLRARSTLFVPSPLQRSFSNLQSPSLSPFLSHSLVEF